MQILKAKLYNSYAELFYHYTKLQYKLSLSLTYEMILFLMIKLRLYVIDINWECTLGISSFILP